MLLSACSVIETPELAPHWFERLCERSKQERKLMQKIGFKKYGIGKSVPKNITINRMRRH